jgi:beta-lactamase class C
MWRGIPGSGQEVCLFSSDSIDETSQKIINNHVSGNRGMVVYIVSENSSDSPRLFYQTNQPIWDKSHDEVHRDDLPRLLFEIGSVTKVFTSRIFTDSYDKTIGSCMPRVPLPELIRKIPIIDIETYSSGFPQDNGHPQDPRGAFCPPSALDNLSDLLTWFNHGMGSNENWICPPGQCYTYSNLSWSMLAIAALDPGRSEKVDIYTDYNRHLGQLCQELAMPLTALFEPNQVPHMACGYKDRIPFSTTENYQPGSRMHFGAGGIVSCASDMLRWLLYNMGRLPASNADRHLLTMQQSERRKRPRCGTTTGKCGDDEGDGAATALGWFLPKATDGTATQVLSKDGGVHGFTSWMGFESWVEVGEPSRNGVVVLAAGQEASHAGKKIMEHLLGTTFETIETGHT